jgi:Uma2 family endonuclease
MLVSVSDERTLGHARLPAQRRAEQIMAMPAVKRRWTAREVRALIAESPLATPRYELVDGELLVTPSPNYVHQVAVSLLLHALMQYLERNSVGRALTSPFDVELAPELIVQPDVFVVPMYEARRLLTEMPARELLVAAEVLSPSSSRHDRAVKRPRYQQHVPDYWIVDLDARLLERWRPGDERPEIVVQTLEWHPSGATEPFRLGLPDYFTEVLGER